MKNPVLVMISGAPATGKTHLARLLADSLDVVVFQKDAIKETLFDTLGEDDREWSRMLGTAAFALLRHLAESHLKARRSVLVESNFQRRYEGPWVAQMQERYGARVLELYCHADMDTVLSRVARRAGTDERHSGHGPGDVAVRELRESYQHYGPVTDGNGLVIIDTTDFDAVDYAAIIERVRSTLACPTRVGADPVSADPAPIPPLPRRERAGVRVTPTRRGGPTCPPADYPAVAFDTRPPLNRITGPRHHYWRNSRTGDRLCPLWTLWRCSCPLARCASGFL